eukprot:Gb_03210 [translate_table: standard]
MASSDDEGKKGIKPPSSGEWSIKAVYSLLESYGQKFAEGRGFLRNKDWEEVVSAVNSGCGDLRYRKTMKQCRDKIDSLKKRYKVEKRRAMDNGLSASSWPYFAQMDEIMKSSCVPKQGKDSGSIPTESCTANNFVCWNCYEKGKSVQAEEEEEEAEEQPGIHDNGASIYLGFSQRKGSNPGTPESFEKSDPERKMESIGVSKKRIRAENRNPIQALADAIVGFSDVYARIEMAKMEIFANMNIQLAKLESRRKRRKC